MESFFKDCVKHWKWFAISAGVGVILFASIHFAGNQIEVDTLLIANSRMGDKISQEGVEPGTVDVRTKRDLKDLVLWLKTYDFMDGFLKSHCAENKAAFCEEYPATAGGALSLIRNLNARIEDDRVLALRVGAPNAETASALANALSAAVIQMYEDQTKMDVKKFEKNLEQKRAEIEERLQSSIKTLSNGDVLPALQTSPEKQYSYLTELQTKVAEADLKISENERSIKVLRVQAKANPNADYGPALDVERLKTETKLLIGNKKSLEAQLKKAVTQQYGSGDDSGSLTRLQEQFRVDLETYTALTRAREKIKLMASVPNMNLEVFQKASPVLARNRWSLMLMIGLGLFLSQLIAATALMIFKLWLEKHDAKLEPQLPHGPLMNGLTATRAHLRHTEYKPSARN